MVQGELTRIRQKSLVTIIKIKRIFKEEMAENKGLKYLNERRISLTYKNLIIRNFQRFLN